MESCAICLNEIDSQVFHPEFSFITLDCKHIFHKHCIALLLSKSKKKELTCPCCRKSLNKYTLQTEIMKNTNENVTYKSLENPKKYKWFSNKIIPLRSSRNIVIKMLRNITMNAHYDNLM